jgi:hypothetical protein
MVNMFSALQTTVSTGAVLLSYASNIASFAQSNGASRLNWEDFGKDEMKELVEDLRKLADGYELPEGQDHADLGEDEEYAFDL